MKLRVYTCIFLTLLFSSCSLGSTLLSLREDRKEDPDFGALWCPSCKMYHSRAAEALYPFACRLSLSGDSLYLQAAIDLGLWLIAQQEAGKYRACYPALKGWPIEITLIPERDAIGDEINFEFRIKRT